jgi:hypothetical protein
MRTKLIIIFYVLIGISLGEKSGLYDLEDRPSISIPSFPTINNIGPIGMLLVIICIFF